LIIRFGYVAMSAILEDCSPSQTITFKNLSKITSAEGKHSKLFTLAKRNLQNIQRLFFHNQAHDIKVFRLTSKLVPLATHPDTQEWNWAMELKQEFKKLGKYAREHGFRLSAHPDHFTLLNSPRDEILAASIKDLEYHRQIFAGMEMDASSKLVIHVGGCYKNKADSLKRFMNSAVFLTTEGSSIVEYLMILEEQGVEILSCGTCLDYYQLKDKLRVGKVTNMYSATEILVSAAKVLKI
jgi:UV DNA damage endonuclease